MSELTLFAHAPFEIVLALAFWFILGYPARRHLASERFRTNLKAVCDALTQQGYLIEQVDVKGQNVSFVGRDPQGEHFVGVARRQRNGSLIDRRHLRQS